MKRFICLNSALFFLLLFTAFSFSDGIDAADKTFSSYNDKGVYYFQSGKHSKALDAFKKALKENPEDADVLFNIALCYEAVGNRKQAKEYYQKTLQFSPDHVDAYNNLGVIYYKEGQKDNAVTVWRKALEINPSYTKATANLKRVGKPPLFPSAKKKKIEAGASPSGGLDEGIKLLKEIIAQGTQDPSLYKALGNALLKKKRHSEALDAFRHAGELSQQDGQLLLTMGTLSAGLKKFDEAEGYFLKAEEAGIETAKLYYYLGALSKKKGDELSAMDYFQKALEKDPLHAPSIEELAQHHFMSGNYVEARKLYVSLLQLRPADATLYWQAGITDYVLDHKDAGIALIRKGVLLKPSLQGYHNLGVAFEKAGRHAEALSSFIKASSYGASAQLYYHLGLLYERTSSPSKAVAHYKKALALKPDFIEAKINLAALLLAQGGISEGSSIQKKGFLYDFIKEKAPARHDVFALP